MLNATSHKVTKSTFEVNPTPDSVPIQLLVQVRWESQSYSGFVANPTPDSEVILLRIWS